MAEPDMDEDLFADLYDGDDNEEPAREPAATTTEPEIDTAEDPSPVIAVGSAGGAAAQEEDTQANQEHTEEHNDMQGMHQQQNSNDFGISYGQPREERPIGTKEDGYVLPFDARRVWVV
ncbi:unnamed protein product [Zymoseptoria tritici ST99CH_3D7]|uniref:Uncharacterized protein n=3 Tax=Zymoseptoria tritici TaxID=1047171 RepID=F9XCU5_ZYMTI|nr:uncharacterized protein MYCGRDRAFT_81098 [Zymoseptoria tritici IPO323]EGP86906.1 hypothetical protein MYCGRDRAFT_81098 [Zymoseptoria tritici IPO323]SMQ51530.1 unnamed protein product [Zymoseptoria tritici ST99CH_3D7]SMR53611.1 unnamed protein product [Zymoseptoria tritici ST99CH_1E4]